MAAILSRPLSINGMPSLTLHLINRSKWFSCTMSASKHEIVRPSCTMCCFNTLRPRQLGRHFLDDILKWIFSNKNVWISKFVPRRQINNIPTLVQIMAWCRPKHASLGLTELIHPKWNTKGMLNTSHNIYCVQCPVNIYKQQTYTHMLTCVHTYICTYIHACLDAPAWRRFWIK